MFISFQKLEKFPQPAKWDEGFNLSATIKYSFVKKNINLLFIRETLPSQNSDMEKKDVISPRTLSFAPIKG